MKDLCGFLRRAVPALLRTCGAGIVLGGVLFVGPVHGASVYAAGTKRVQDCDFGVKPATTIVTTLPFPHDWRIVVVCNPTLWDGIQRQAPVNYASRWAITVQPNHVTFINADVFRPGVNVLVDGTAYTPRHILAHELGHILCRCNSEEKAESFAARLSTAPGKTIPFKLRSGYLIEVAGIVNGRKCRFLLDTGATYSAVTPKLANKLRLAQRPSDVVNFNQVLHVRRADVPLVDLGPIQASQVPMLVADLGYSSDISGIDGVIGLDLLRNTGFTIDYRHKELRFGNLEPMRFQVPMASDGIALTVELQVSDHPLRVIVDTGMRDILLYRDRSWRELSGLTVQRQGKGWTAGGQFDVVEVNLSRARLGDAEVGGTALITAAPPQNVLAGIAGYLGPAALRARKVEFNFGNHTFGWEP